MIRKRVGTGFLAGAILSVSYSFGIELQIRFSGGLNYLSLNNVNAMLSSWAERARKEAALEGWEFQGGAPAFHSGFHFQAEFIVFLAPKSAISLGTGYLYKEALEEETSLTVKKETITSTTARPTKVSATPIEISVIQHFPLRSNLSLYVRGGAGIIAATYVDREANWKQDEKKFLYPTSQLAKAHCTTWQAGIGVSYLLEPSMGFFIETSGRLAKAKAFEGENKSGLKGSLYYLEEYDQSLDLWQSKLLISTERPDGENLRSVQKAVVDFSGVSLRVGVFLIF